jgi:hypothetical protein
LDEGRIDRVGAAVQIAFRLLAALERRRVVRHDDDVLVALLLPVSSRSSLPLASRDPHGSLTDPERRSTSRRRSGMVGYNVQVAIDTEHHLIVAHEATNSA